MTDSDKKIPEKINKWNLVLLATLLVAVIVTGGWFYYNYQASIIKENKHQEIKAISELKLDQIIYWQNERKSDIKVVSNLLSIIKSVELWQATKSDNALANIVDYLESVKETYNYHDILITTPNGELILSLSPEEKSSLAIPHSTIKESAETKNIVFSPLYIHEEKNEIHYDLTAPILDRNNEVLAIMLFRMLPEDYLYPLIHSWPTSDKSAETLIARQESDGVLFLNELRHKKNTTLKLHLPLSRMELPIVQAAKGYRGVWEGKDYRGVEVLSYVSDIPGTPWYMVTKVDETEIYAELNFLAVVVSLFTLFLLILTGAGFAGIYSSRQKNVFKALFLKEKEYSENLEEFRTILYSIGDAVITTDINGRVRELNPRAEKLTGWKKEEAIGENHNVVFRLIDEKTRESLGDPFRMAMAEGKPIDSAKNTALIAKDGVEIPISERAAPINNLDGENIGVVFVFRDQTEERKTQAAILLNEERYRGLFHSIADAILVANTDREIIDCNKGFEKLFGYSKSEILGTKTSRLYHSQEEFEKMGAELKQHSFDEPFLYPIKYIDKSGKVFVGETSVYFIKDEQNQTAGIVGIVRDISDKLEKEVKLAESEKKFRNLFNSVSIPLSYVKSDGTIESLNNRFVEVLGYTLNDMPVIDRWWELAYPDKNYREWVMRNWSEAVQKSIEEGTDIKSDIYNVRCKNGVIKNFIVAGVTIESDVLTTFIDVTEQKAAEKKLVEENEFTESVINSMPGIFYLFNQQGKFIKWNNTLADLSGIPFKDVAQKSPLEIIAPHHREIIQNAIETVFAEGEVFVEADFLAFGRENIPFYFTGIRIIRNGEPLLLGVGIDISKRKKALEELKKVAAELKRSNQELEQFAYVASHDLQEPLRMVSSYTQLLAKRYSDKLDRDAKDFIGFAVDGASRMQTLIQDLLQFSRVTTKGKPFAKVDFEDVVQQALLNLKNVVETSNAIVIKFNMPFVIGDFGQLVRLVQNLIGNSIKYIHNVTPEIEISYEELESEHHFLVEDNGIGIAPEFQSRIFEIFERLHTKDKFEGTGIGLAVCKKIVERHGGKIWVESELENGSIFHFTISKNL